MDQRADPAEVVAVGEAVAAAEVAVAEAEEVVAISPAAGKALVAEAPIPAEGTSARAASTPAAANRTRRVVRAAPEKLTAVIPMPAI